MPVSFKHPRAIRWFHWAHFPVLAIMIWSGTLIYWADPFITSIPKSVYEALGIDHHLAEGMAYHFFFMWLFALNGVAYVAYLALSGEWRHLSPGRHAWRDAWQVTLHELGLSKKKPPHPGKYNAAQRIAYAGVILMGLGSLMTGLAIYKPVQLLWLTEALGGYHAARIEHFCLTSGYVAFFLIHVTQVVRAGWNNFRSMVSGYEVSLDESRNPKK